MFQKVKHSYLQSGYILPLSIAFLLPFGVNYGIIIICWALCFFLFDDFKPLLKNVFKSNWSFVLLSFFILHVIGYFFSYNKHDAANAIEIKLSFLAFPLLIFASNYKDLHLKTIIISFVSGCVIAGMICLFRAFYLFYFENFNAFFYSEFSYFMHPSYFAMYLIFAMLIVIIFYPKWLSHINHLSLKLGFVTILFLSVIFLCSSKMGLIAAVLLLPLTLAIVLYLKGFKKLIVGLVVLLVLVITAAYKFFPSPFERIKTAFKVTTSSQVIDKSDAESTAVRILIWKESLKLIKQNFVFGTTPGDVHDKLIDSYQREGLTGALKKKLNAHNQFLQTFIGTGVLGFVLLLLMTAGAALYGIIRKNYILFLFSFLMILNFLVESMLQAQAGFIFFVFFFCFLTHYNLHALNKTP